MTDAAFECALAEVLGHEGGFQCNPHDAGNWTGGKIGAGSLIGTNFGISAAQYPEEDIPHLTRERAAEIYQRDYWLRGRIWRLPGALLPAKVMDTAVLAGTTTAIIVLQRALNALGARVDVDGAIGPNTILACRCASSDALLAMYRELLVSHYEKIAADDPDKARFLDGWRTRALA